MPRKPQEDRLVDIFHKVEENPGEHPGTIARRLGLNRSEVTRALPALEDTGLLLSEDDRGGLWPFSRKKRES